MESSINFGLKISKLIKESGYTKTKVAEMFGYSLPGLSKIEDKEDVSTSVLKIACEVFGVGMEYFLLPDSKNIIQKGNANVAGGGTVQYKGMNNSIGNDNIIKMLESENEHLKKQIQLLEQMVAILNEKKT